MNNLNERARFYGGRGSLSIYDVRAVLDYYDHKCLFIVNPDTGERCGKVATSLDHVIPLVKGGENSRRNAQCLCTEHNKAKRDDDTDYRPIDKPFCPDDYEADDGTKTKVLRRHDYGALKAKYLADPELSLRQLAEQEDMIYTLLLKRSADEGWYQEKQELGIKVTDKAIAEIVNSKLGNEINMRMLLQDVIAEVVNVWKAKPEAKASDIAALLKLGLASQGEVTDRWGLDDNKQTDDAAILARISSVFDGGQEERTLAPLGLDGEETGAGYTD